MLARLVLEKEVVKGLLRTENIIRESSIYQLFAEEIDLEILEKVREEVQKKVREEIREKNTRLVVVNMLKEGLSMEIIAKVTGLTIEQVQQVQITAVENDGN